MLFRLTNPTGLAVPLAMAKSALRVDTDDDDLRLESLIRAETTRYENFTGRILVPVELEYRLNEWRSPVHVPIAPLREVTGIAYLDEDDVEQVIAGDWYEVRLDDGFEVWFPDGYSFPSLSRRPQPVRIRFEAGYDDPGASGSGDDPELAPVELDQINIIRMVQRIYDHDELMPDIEMIQTMGSRRIFR